MGRVRGAVPVAVALGAAGLLALVLGFALTLNPIDLVLGRGRSVVLGDFVGSSLPGVRAELESAGLVVTTRNGFSLTVPRGSVLAQEPLPGSRVAPGGSVSLVVSRGAVRVVLDDLVGRPLEQARGSLDEAGVTVEVVERPDESVPAGVVLEQEPGPGLEVQGDAVARLVVSAGPAPRPVPDVSGRSLPVASYALGAFGFDVVEVRGTSATDLPPGAVVGTDPPAGTTSDRGTPVVVVVSGDAPPTPVPAVVGEPAGAAAEAIRAAGFQANVVTANELELAFAAPSTAEPGRPVRPPTPGTVVLQSPAAGIERRPTSVVTLVVAP